ncbi:MAG: transglycosylase domain-containing protein [Oscillospiraceae bacterium]|nr:transglycosylase domain-containing protein [Oscillospiraceae bacterium]
MAKQLKQKQRKKPNTFLRVLRGIAMTLLSMFLVGFLTTGIVGGYFFIHVNAVVGGEPVINLEEEKANQSLTTIIYAYDSKGDEAEEVEYARLHGEENRIWIDLEDIPQNMLDAYIALEDKRYREHKGVDWVRLAGVMTQYGFSQGASTLTQQLIKNLTGEKDVTTIRKFREILTALNLEKNYSKDVILEAYLNTLYLGNGCYGIRTGAEKYYGKEVDELNLAECAALAAITQAPYKYDPLINPENNRERQIDCLFFMKEQGIIDQATYDEAVAYEMVFTNSEGYKPKKTAQPSAQPQEINNFYVDFIIETVIEDLMKQREMSRTEATRKVYYGGLKIYAAVDMDIQKSLEEVYRKRVTFSDLKGSSENPINSAMTIMDYEGRVVALAGQAGEKPGNRSLNRAAASWRQPGSTIKPFNYGAAIEKNLITWSTMIKNQAFAYKGMMWPKNADGTLGTGAMVTVQYALERSLNTVAARTVNEYLTVEGSFNFLRDNFGFQKLDKVNDMVLPSVAVGGMYNGFSTLEECAAYAAFGNGGMYYSPFCYYKVTNNTGTEMVLERDQIVKRAFSAETAMVMNKMLATVPVSGYGSGDNRQYISKFPYFAKTGTTSDNKDRWFAAGTPYYVGSVWLGYDTPKDLGTMQNPSARIWTEVFNRIHKDLDSGKKFPTSDNAVSRSYCKSSGLIAGDHCAEKATGWYKKDNIPKNCGSCAAPVLTTSPSDGTNGGGVTIDPWGWVNQILGGN